VNCYGLAGDRVDAYRPPVSTSKSVAGATAINGDSSEIHDVGGYRVNLTPRGAVPE
jgi:hypothetical protein